MDEKYIVVGTGNLAVRIAEYLIVKKLQVSVYEKQLSQHSSVKDVCADKNIEYYCLTSEEMTNKLLDNLSKQSLKIISAINTYIFPKEIVLHPNFTGINYHNALLPEHRGMNAEAWTIFSMDEYTGITWHKIAISVDKGNIISQKKILLDSTMTSIKLLRIQLDMAYESFIEFAPEFIFATVSSEPQLTGISHFHYINEKPNNGIINTQWNAEQTSAFLRSMDYGIFYTMGKPVIEIDGHFYSCGRYKIIEENTYSDNNSVSFNGKEIILIKKDSCLKIILTNIEKCG